MKLFRKLGVAIATAAILFGSVSAAQAAPQTAPANMVSPKSLCSSSNVDIAISQVARHYVKGSYRLAGSPGAHLTIAAGTTSTITGTITLSTTVEAGAIFAKASVSAGVSLALSKATTVTYSVSATIPSQGGYIELGADGRSFAWTATRYNNNCVVSSHQVGSAVGATSTPYGYLSWVGFK
ncbi:hypothetical protein FHU41_000209 [Psychromicrobium silvestre]|uniref:Uncharacterized protein n=1 Tax=Psychromicrobium silvestre TaxID=1645614 RepID=A0A7Y9LR11_9MICC|nr:hypothetical protein [Psychromicrobium silvestre]NYE93988.1 hypothetical protein [Psychromicrobium silvestre]